MEGREKKSERKGGEKWRLGDKGEKKKDGGVHKKRKMQRRGDKGEKEKKNENRRKMQEVWRLGL